MTGIATKGRNAKLIRLLPEEATLAPNATRSDNFNDVSLRKTAGIEPFSGSEVFIIATQIETP